MYLACSFFIEFDAFFVRKKEQTIYEMDVGERREWERMEKHREDRKIGNSDFIDSVGDNLSPTHTLEQCK